MDFEGHIQTITLHFNYFTELCCSCCVSNSQGYSFPRTLALAFHTPWNIFPEISTWFTYILPPRLYSKYSSQKGLPSQIDKISNHHLSLDNLFSASLFHFFPLTIFYKYYKILIMPWFTSFLLKQIATSMNEYKILIYYMTGKI